MTEFRLNVGVLNRAAAARAAPLVEAIAVVARDEVVETMEGASPRSGRQYPMPGTSSTYTASAPGEPPAVREGRYLASIKSTRAARTGSRVRARAYTDLRVGTNDEYILGDLLEHGTTKMKPRPHWRPALHAAAERARQLVREAGGE